MTQIAIFHARFKHMKLDYHFTKEKVLAKAFITKHLSTQLQRVDICIMSLSRKSFEKCKFKLGV